MDKNKIYTRKGYKNILPVICLLFSVVWTLFGLERLLLTIAEYNVYRVLDLSIAHLIIVLSFLLVQYGLFKRSLSFIPQIWEIYKNNKIPLWSLLLISGAAYALIPSSFPFWIFYAVIGAFAGLGFLNQKLQKIHFQNTLFLLLFSAGLNASLIFWSHEEGNKLVHHEYAKELAVIRDSIAEQQLLQLIETVGTQPVQENQQVFWEKKCLENHYLSSNYKFDFHQIKSPSLTSFFKPILELSEDGTVVYRLFFPDDFHLSFTLDGQFRRSVYTENQAYKNMHRLHDYQFTVVNNGLITLSNTHDFDLNIFDIDLPPVGTSQKMAWGNYDALVYHHSEGVYTIIGEPLSEFQIWISNFAFFFIFTILVIVIWQLLSFVFYKKNNHFAAEWNAIEYRIQANLLFLTLFVFFIIGLTTFIFLHQNNKTVLQERELYIAETLRKEFLEEQAQYGWKMEDFSVSFLRALADRKRCDIDVYDTNGNLLASSIASSVNSPASSVMDKSMQENLDKNPGAILVEKSNTNEYDYLKTYFSIWQSQQLQGYVVTSAFEAEISTANDIPIIMSKLLNVYVFLLLLTWGVGIVLIKILTKPLEILASHLNDFKLGKNNQKLTWAGDDAIGTLIQKYNKMVDDLAQNAIELAHSEREKAWQIMAQQIAHEINNALTPLKLNIQFLSYSLGGISTTEVGRVQHITQGLEGQIEHLAKVAARFKLFANMDNPEIQRIDLVPFLGDFCQQIPEDEHYQFNLKIETDSFEPNIKIDPNHFKQVLQNLANYFIQRDMGEDKKILDLVVGGNEKNIVVQVVNPHVLQVSSVQEDIFDLSFSTNANGSGLDLPLCKKIIEFYHGELKIKQDLGIAFVIRFPFMQEE